MKQLLTTFLLCLLFFELPKLVKAQEADKTVTLTVSGAGKTIEKARQNAVNSAIEEAFGTFISSKTELLNDKYVSNQITSISNNNIQKFDVVSEIQLSDDNYATTLKVTVSITKLISFAESKGMTVEYKGSSFGEKIIIMKLNETNEIKAVSNLCAILKSLANKSYDFSVTATEPIVDGNNPHLFNLEYNIKVSPNNNYSLLINYFLTTIYELRMTGDETDSYKEIQKKYFKLNINTKGSYYFRSLKSLILIKDAANYLDFATTFFTINDGSQKIKVSDGKLVQAKTDYHYDLGDISFYELKERRNIERSENIPNEYPNYGLENFWLFLSNEPFSECPLTLKTHETSNSEYWRNNLIGLYHVEKLNLKLYHTELIKGIYRGKKSRDDDWSLGHRSDSSYNSPSATQQWAKEEIEKLDEWWANDSTAAFSVGTEGGMCNVIIGSLVNHNYFQKGFNDAEVCLTFPTKELFSLSYKFTMTYSTEDIEKIQAINVKPIY